MSWLELLAVVAIIGFVIYQQIAGQKVQGKRLVVLPAVHVAASSTPLLFTLGLNRLAQAAVIAPRAMLAGIPFAPEKDGRTFGSGAFKSAHNDQSRRY